MSVIVCPRCNLPVGGIQLGIFSAAQQYKSLLDRTWTEGSIACLRNQIGEISERRDLSYEDCPYDAGKEPALHVAWMGGVYYAKFRLLDQPEKYTTAKITEYIVEYNTTSED